MTKNKVQKYTICECCHQEMSPKNGCKAPIYYHKGKPVRKVKVGDCLDFYHDMEKDSECTDCNAGFGQYHHFGCDCERCPVCGLQFIGCECDINLAVLEK